MIRFIDGVVGAFEGGHLTRRELVERLGAFFAVAAGVAPAALAEEAEPATIASPTFQATEVNHVALRVTDVARSREFYKKHLGLRVTSDRSPSNCFLSCGDNFLALFRNDKAGMDHYCFSIKDYEAGRAVDTLKRVGLEPERHANRVYFLDPDGLQVQVSARNDR